MTKVLKEVDMSTTNRTDDVRASRRALAVWCTCALIAALLLGSRASAQSARVFASPEEAVKALIDAARKGQVAGLIAVFGAEDKELFESADPVTARQNRRVFIVATAEQWRLEDAAPNRKTLVIGNEEWPFPVPLVKDEQGWHFDTAAGIEEVIARRIGRNELAAIATVHAYVTAQRQYGAQAHNGNPTGVYATRFASDPGKENGLYWPAKDGQQRSPLGDLVAQAAAEGRAVGGERSQPSPFHGYYFRILLSQGSAAKGGKKQYVAKGLMSGGFALVAWPAQYDVTGVMTFVVNQDGIVHEQDLGPDTDAAARKMTAYNPDKSWRQVQ
ncbi:MAG: DUF2950 domain-containing protein [Vicinamibacterales bacterium]